MAISVTIQRPNLQDGDILDAAALTAITAVNVSISGAVASDEFLAYKAQVTAALNAAVAALVLPPVGAVIPFAGFDAPVGWLPCDGRSLVRSEHPKLFTAIGITGAPSTRSISTCRTFAAEPSSGWMAPRDAPMPQ